MAKLCDCPKCKRERAEGALRKTLLKVRRRLPSGIERSILDDLIKAGFNADNVRAVKGSPVKPQLTLFTE